MTRRIFNMPSALDAVDPMVLALRAVVAPVLEDETRFRFELCVTEALSNLVEHAPGAPIRIALTATRGQAQVVIMDPADAPPFDPRAHATDLSQVDALAEGGRGVGLILACADDVTYGPAGASNSLCLTFRHREQTNDPFVTGAVK